MRPVVMSAGFGTVGAFVGGAVAGVSAAGCYGDQCEIDRVVRGALFGISVGAALGAHLGNRKRGSLALNVLGGFGAAAAGLIVSNVLMEDNGGPILLLVPIGEVAATVAIERAFGRRRARILAMPVLAGGDPGMNLRILL